MDTLPVRGPDPRSLFTYGDDPMLVDRNRSQAKSTTSSAGNKESGRANKGKPQDITAKRRVARPMRLGRF